MAELTSRTKVSEKTCALLDVALAQPDGMHVRTMWNAGWRPAGHDQGTKLLGYGVDGDQQNV